MADPIRKTQQGSVFVGKFGFGVPRFLLFALLGITLLVGVPEPTRSIPSLDLQDLVAAVQSGIPEEPKPVLAPSAKATSVAVKESGASRYHALVDFLAKRYRVSKSALEDFVAYAHTAGQATKVDPLLILAVMAVESGFNPIAESVMGAKGLMQVIPKYHPEKFVGQNGEVNVLDPATNILAGAKVLREYAARTGDDLVAALGLYGGTGPSAENAYATRVLAELDRLEQVIKRPVTRRAAPQPTSTSRPAQPEAPQAQPGHPAS